MTRPPTDQGLDRPSMTDATARALVAAIPDPIFRIGVDGRYRGFKVDSERDLVTPPDQVIGRTVHERLEPEVADAILASGRRAVADGEPQQIEYSLEIDGERREFEGRVVACGEDEFMLIVRDFTERARQARELEHERDFNLALVRSVPSFLAVVDERGILVGINRALERAAGFDEATWVGRPFWQVFLSEADVARAQEDFARLRADEAPGVVEYEHVSSTGERLVVDWTATVVRDADGRLRYLLSGLDVTARKRAEEEVRRSRARIVSASDAERKRLERNLHDGAQQHLVSVSHAVHLGLRSLRSDPDVAESHFQRALAELNTAHEGLRELARGLHPQLLTTQGLSAAVRSLAGRAPVPVTVVTVDEGERWPPLIESAAYYVVAEAITNTIKYAGASSATIRIVPEAGRLCVEVADDGCGGARATPGSGLGGLADRVEALDGRFRIESPAGGGTRIRAELPLPRDDRPSA